MTDTHRIRILFLAASPGSMGQLNASREAREIRDRLRATPHRDSIELVERFAVRPGDLQQTLFEVQPHVVHFSGHGTTDEEIVLVNDDGGAEPLGKRALTDIFRVHKDQIRVAVLNACHSRPQVEAISEHIECAIGMRRAIGSQAAIEFSAAFYLAIGFGGSVQSAFESAVTQLRARGIPEDHTPQLVRRHLTDPTKVFLINAPARPTLASERPAIDETPRAPTVDDRPPREGRPKPTFPDSATEALSGELLDARRRQKRLERAGADTREVIRQILDLKRRIRDGGQLRAGDALGEGRYLLLDELGRGGFGVVWRAHDEETGAVVAIKVLHANLAGDVVRRSRFGRGARLMNEIRHEAVVRVLCDHGEDGGWHYFVMELVPGGDLRRAVLEGRITGKSAVQLLLPICDAMALAHRRGVVHRDIKPSNILVDASGKLKITDFDLVSAHDTTGGTRTGAMGSVLYTAPEAIDQPAAVDARADVYSLGMTAIFALHGADLPITMMGRADRIIDQLPCCLALRVALSRAVSWDDPENRFADAAALRDALSPFFSPPVVSVPSTAPWDDTLVPDSEPNPGATQASASVYSWPLALSSDRAEPKVASEWIMLPDRYEFLGWLGAGAFGQVCRVHDRDLGRELAMKILHGKHSSSRRTRARFLSEARLTAGLKHPGIIVIRDQGELSDGRLWLTMNMVSGRTLDRVIADVHNGAGSQGFRATRSGWTFLQLVDVFARVCQAVAYAHQRGVVHRDIKPGNLMVGEFGEVLVMDWALGIKIAALRELPGDRAPLSARPSDNVDPLVGADMLTMDGEVVGTPAYMPPEQIRGERNRVGPWSDVYSLGATLYHVLAGEPRYAGMSPQLMMQKTIRGEPLPPIPASDGPPVPRDLVAIYERAMRHDPVERYPTAEELARDVIGWIDMAARSPADHPGEPIAFRKDGEAAS